MDYLVCMKNLNRDNFTEEKLLNLFNNRVTVALGEVYNLFSLDLNTYTAITYHDYEVEEEDIVHDIFVKVWSSNLEFDSIAGIKAYMIASIKNSYKNFLKHQSHIDKYADIITNEEGVDLNYIESELYSKRREILDSLPANFVKVMELYLNGYKSAEIAKILNYSEQTVYNVKNKAIHHLRKKLGGNGLYILFLISFLN